MARRLAGTFIPEDDKPPVAAWVQEQLRTGSLQAAVLGFIRVQPEVLDLDRVQVEAIAASGIRCRIPRFVADHESSRPLRDDVLFDLNPVTGHVRRI